ncbi:MAG: PIN domain-containing protein [Propionibacteriaceae bacterium]|nr:PIN domain-containing protein [Propionibacteriaceae bacterium]
MTRFLLDVNVLISLLDPTHVHHERAHRWFEGISPRGWLSCPTTQNGVVRIVCNPRYSNSQPTQLVCDSLESLLRAGQHEFVPDSISLLGPYIDRAHLLNSSQVTDSYLLALAVHHGAHLATFDTRLVTSSVRRGSEAIATIR